MTGIPVQIRRSRSFSKRNKDLYPPLRFLFLAWDSNPGPLPQNVDWDFPGASSPIQAGVLEPVFPPDGTTSSTLMEPPVPATLASPTVDPISHYSRKPCPAGLPAQPEPLPLLGIASPGTTHPQQLPAASEECLIPTSRGCCFQTPKLSLLSPGTLPIYSRFTALSLICLPPIQILEACLGVPPPLSQTDRTALMRPKILTSCSPKSELLHPHTCACYALALRADTSQNLPVRNPPPPPSRRATPRHLSRTS